MRSLFVGAAMLAVLGAAAACGGAGTPTNDTSSSATAQTSASESSSQHNKADVRFAQSMIPHHKQAVAMAEMVLQRSDDGKLHKLAKQIKAAQAPEIRQLKSMLSEWGEPVQPQADMKGMSHGKMSGMMSEEQMSKLRKATGAEFDTMWLEMMIEHHKGAVEMSNKELDQGTNPEAKQLAREIIKAQQGEIEQMRTMLAA